MVASMKQRIPQFRVRLGNPENSQIISQTMDWVSATKVAACAKGCGSRATIEVADVQHLAQVAQHGELQMGYITLDAMPIGGSQIAQHIMLVDSNKSTQVSDVPRKPHWFAALRAKIAAFIDWLFRVENHRQLPRSQYGKPVLPPPPPPAKYAPAKEDQSCRGK